jgi:hypothetical protein
MKEYHIAFLMVKYQSEAMALQITRIVVIMAPTPHSQLLLSEIDGEQE